MEGNVQIFLYRVNFFRFGQQIAVTAGYLPGAPCQSDFFVDIDLTLFTNLAVGPSFKYVKLKFYDNKIS